MFWKLRFKKNKMKKAQGREKERLELDELEPK